MGPLGDLFGFDVALRVPGSGATGAESGIASCDLTAPRKVQIAPRPPSGPLRILAFLVTLLPPLADGEVARPVQWQSSEREAGSTDTLLFDAWT